jgi:hypothetical protein
MHRRAQRRSAIAFVIAIALFGPQVFAECLSNTVNVSNTPDAGAQSVAQDVAVSGDYVYVVWEESVGLSHDAMLKVSANGGKTFGLATNLSNNLGFFARPRVAAAGSSVYVVWADNTGGTFQILFRGSTDHGANFGPTQVLSSPSGGGEPQIAVSGGILFVTFVGDGDIWLRASTDGGTNFNTLNLSSNAGSSGSAELTANAGKAYVVWADQSSGNDEVLFRQITNNGTTLGTIKTLSSGGQASFPKIELSGSNVYVVWQDTAAGAEEVFFTASYDDGSSFLASPTNISSNGAASRHPRVAASGMNVYVVWYDGIPDVSTDTLIRISSNGGSTFDGIQNLSNTGASVFPEVGAAGSRVWVVWQGNGLILRSSANAGGVFDDPVTITSDFIAFDSAEVLVSGEEAYFTWVAGIGGEVFLSTTVQAGKPFGGNVNVSNNPAFSGDPRIAVVCNHVYVAWFDAIFPVVFKASHDGGATFGSLLNLIGLDGAPSDLTMTASGSYVYVAFTKVLNGNRDAFVMTSADLGSSFGAAVNVSNSPPTSARPELSARGNNVYVVWQEDFTADLWSTRSLDGGVSFDPPQNISATAANSREHQIVSAGNNVYVVWKDDPGVLYFNASHNSAQSFLGPVTLPGGILNPPKLAASGSDVYIANDGGNPNIRLHRSTNGGLSFNAPVQVSNTNVQAVQPQLAIAGSNVYVSWLETLDNSLRFRPSTTQGASFGNIVTITTQPGNFLTQKLAASGSKVYVAWRDFTLGNLEVFLKVSHDEGKGFSTGLNLSNTPQTSNTPQLVALGGSAYVLWGDNGIGGGDVLLRGGIPSIGGVQSATGAGAVAFAATAGGFSSITASLPPPGQPAGTSFPFGFFGWTLTGLTHGQTVTVTLTYPTNIPLGAEYWKVINGVWTNLTLQILSDDDGDNVLVLTIQDGGDGDVDGLVNGEISDPGGVALFYQPIVIDIKPDSFPNTVNPKEKGRLVVAVLTTGGFNAATVDRSQVRFGASGTEAAPVHAAEEDVDKDGDVDLLLHFEVADTGISCGHTSASLTGATTAGTAIKGTDSIRTVGCK